MHLYTYQPLDVDRIRLVRLLPGSYDDGIQCELVHYTLRSSRTRLPFEALSYVWGDTTQLSGIQIRTCQDGHAQYLEITQNLHAALRRLRDPELERMLWIDAICMFDGTSHL
jgi:hypothetical protein